MNEQRRIIPAAQTRPAFTRAEVLVCAALLVIALATLVPAVAIAAKNSREKSNLAVCKDNLRAVGIALLAYAADNHARLPVSPNIENPHTQLLHALAANNYINDPKRFYCPSESHPERQLTRDNWQTGNIGYFYYSAEHADDPRLSKFLRTGLTWPRNLNTTLPPNTWLMSDAWFSGDPTAHTAYKKGLNYLMLDGSTDFVTDGPRKSFH